MVSAAFDDSRATRTGTTVLFLAANPVEIPLLQLGEECRAIEDKIRAASFREKLRFRSRWAARPDDLLQALHEDDPTVLHFSGHGTGAQGLCFLAEDGGVLSVNSDGLGQVIRAAGDSIQLVVLNACYTKVQAQSLVAHVPCVIGMPSVIGDKSAIVYVAELYRALAFGKSVARAHQCGLALLAIHSMAGHMRDIDMAESALRTAPPELLVRTGVDPGRVYIVQGAQSVSTVPASSSESRIHLEIDVDADFETLDANTLSKLVSEICRLSGGRPVRILCVTKGSIRLYLSFEPEAARMLMNLRHSGHLNQLGDLRVLKVVELGLVETSFQALDHAVRDAQIGEARLSLVAAREAVEFCRVLAGRNPDAFQPSLASSLRQLGAMLREAGQHEPAIVAIREAVAVHRALLVHNREALPELAASLRDLGILLRERGEHPQALLAVDEATGYYRELATHAAERFRLELARSLHNLGLLRCELRQYDAALAATREAVELHRAVATDHPDEAKPDLAGSLNNLGNRLRELGKHERALVATCEAVDLFRDLAARHPLRFQRDLAIGLYNLGIVLRELGEHGAALVATRELVEVNRALAAHDPPGFQSELADSLTDLGNRYQELDRYEDALAAAQEVADLHRKLAMRDPARFEPCLAKSLVELSDRYRALGRGIASLAAAREAVELYRALAARDPETFRPCLADTLNNLGVDLTELGHRVQALDVTREAVELYRRLMENSPNQSRVDLARSKRNIAAIEAAIEALILPGAMSALPQRRPTTPPQPGPIHPGHREHNKFGN
jgi:tetratricopeptide (TPR) repeat protein